MEHDLFVISGTVLDESIQFTLVELCEYAKTTTEQIAEMIDEGIIEPKDISKQNGCFDTAAFKRLQIALRLQRDLGVNLPGSALVLDLLEEMEQLRQQLPD